MADAPLKFNPTLPHHVEDVLLAHEHSARLLRGLCVFRIWRRDHADPNVGVDGVWESESVTDYRAILLRS